MRSALRARTPIGSHPAPRRFLSGEEIATSLEAIRTATAEKGLRVAVIGGVAMQAYGSDRLTLDVDVIAEFTLGQHPSFEIVEPITFGGLSYRGPAGVPVDLIVRKDEYRPLYEEALATAVSGKGPLPVCAPECLAALKFAAGREKDRLDLVYLVTTPGLLDPERTRDLVYRLVGGRFARDVFDETVDQILWMHRRDRDRGRQA
jgi:hypothetical protein